MFDIGNFMSTFDGTGANGFDIMIMESTRKREYLEKAFQQCIIQGLDVNEYQFTIYEQLDIIPEDLLDIDQKILKENVEKMVRRYGR